MLTPFQIYMGMFEILCVGIGLGWMMGGLTPMTAKSGFYVFLFWVLVAIGLHYVPESWILAEPMK